MNATMLRIEPMALTQHTAVGRASGRAQDWYIYQRYAAGVTYYEAAPHPTDADFPVEFVCAVTAPSLMLGTRQETRAEIGRAVLAHAKSLGLISL